MWYSHKKNFDALHAGFSLGFPVAKVDVKTIFSERNTSGKGCLSQAHGFQSYKPTTKGNVCITVSGESVLRSGDILEMYFD
ncbi:hypothetical protein TWF281_008814 [Arthrobotrys megalospora]